MGRKKKPGKKQQQRKKGPFSSATGGSAHHPMKNREEQEAWLNFVLDAGPGCHLAHREQLTADRDDNLREGQSGFSSCGWVLDWEQVELEDFVENETDDEMESRSMTSNQNLPDLGIDPEKGTITLCNARSEHVVAYITVFDRTLRGRNNHILQAGSTTTEDGTRISCTTLIVLCPPCTFCHLCYISAKGIAANNHQHQRHSAGATMESLDDIRIESDVQIWNRHPNPNDTHPRLLGFPLDSSSAAAAALNSSFLCTQGEGGRLTHFFAGNLHAIDFRCPIGTPLLAVGDGVVVDAKDELCHLSGVAVSNLFSWNSILIQLDDTSKSSSSANDGSDRSDVVISAHATGAAKESDNLGRNGDEVKDGPLFVEYVHISSSNVKKGDRVKRGQVIGRSGTVGFSPEPHLHFAAYRSGDPTAPTVRVYFELAYEEPLVEAQQDGTLPKSSSLHEAGAPLTPSTTRTPGFLPMAGRWYNHTGEVKKM